MSLSSQSGGEPKSRQVGATELSWCRAVPGGTGITVLALLFSKQPDLPFLENALRKLQTSHPILNSRLRFDPASNSFSYVTPQSPHIQIQPFDLQSTAQILPNEGASIPPLQLVLEHELNKNSWQNPDPSSDVDLFFASLYSLEKNMWVLALRLHTSACDRAAAAALLSQLVAIMEEKEGVEGESGKEMKASFTIEDCIPCGQGNKPFWARGVDMLGYSLNSFRLANLSFKDTASPRLSRVVRLRMNAEDTARILSRCNSNKIKLSAALAAAGLLACYSSKRFPDEQWEKYAVVTLMDCRSALDPVLNSHHIGFYHSAILHTHDVNGGEDLWELAKRVHSSFMNAKNKNKHFTDMADLNFLMCKAIENPSLTPASSLRTSLVSVFEDPMFDPPNKLKEVIGLEDFIGCASVHGVGPSMAVFDTIRDGKLDCAFVYPFPLFSREQMQEFMDKINRILLKGIA
ncbi:GATA zinc finger protein [Perilla frutescens var. frutescens]|nr:GATA zinc finger protein [Perilla frutescens var. frutescens]